MAIRFIKIADPNQSGARERRTRKMSIKLGIFRQHFRLQFENMMIVLSRRSPPS
jgi:hypothetical protein